METANFNGACFNISAARVKRTSNVSSTTESSRISTAAIQAIVDSLKSERYRDSTRQTYYRIWKLFNKFFIRLDDKPDTWENRLVLFTSFLMDNQLKLTTVRMYISAIRGVLQENDVELHEDQYLLSSLTKACKVKNDKLITRLRIGKGLLNLLINEVKCHFQHRGQNYLAILYASMLAAGYYGLLRIGELTKGPHVILAANMHIGINKNKLLFILRSSKTHNKGSKPQMVKISQKQSSKESKTTKPLPKSLLNNPFSLLQDFFKTWPASRSDTEQLFVFRDNSPMKSEQFRMVLKMLISNIGLEPHLYNGHSLRMGRTGDLMRMGVSVETIKHLGRWKSNAVFTYLHNF